MYNLTQTTGSTNSQGRVRAYYSFPGNPAYGDTWVQQVCALVPAPAQEATGEQCGILRVPCMCERCRPTGLYRTYEQPTTGIRLWLYETILSQGRESGNPTGVAFIPPRSGGGSSSSFL